MSDLSTNHLLRHELAKTERFNAPQRLLKFGWKAHSQNEEDGMLAEIFRRIGTQQKRFIEFGVGNGTECNTLALLLQGWRGAWMDGSAQSVAAARGLHHGMADKLEIVECVVTAENVDRKLSSLGLSDELDLLSIDTDFNDYWLWNAIVSARPRVVVIEYNATYPPPISITVAYEPTRTWDTSSYFGASLSALAKLGREKGYSLVGCCLSGINAFFVRDDLVADKFHGPFTAEEHYEPPRYWLALPSGHRPGVGPWCEV